MNYNFIAMTFLYLEKSLTQFEKEVHLQLNVGEFNAPVFAAQLMRFLFAHQVDEQWSIL